MEFIDEQLNQYCLQHTEEEDAVLKELQRETHLKVMSPRMLSGHLQGSWLSFLSHLVKPQLALEIGTYTGYSAICIAKGLSDNGKLITIDINEETETIARQFFEKSGLQEKIDQRTGDARLIIPEIKNALDFVFIDADKRNYSVYYDLVIDKVRPGGIIIADNVLWSGKILDLARNKDADTVAIHSFNEKIKNDTRIEKILLPLRDGLFVMRKK